MLLEQVMQHERNDIYIDKIITPHGEVKEEDKFIIRKILYKEFQRFLNHSYLAKIRNQNIK